MNDKIYKQIIDSAEKLFNRFGVNKTAISDVAEMANVSRATIFNNFGNKDGLVEALLKNKLEEFRSRLKKSIRGNGSQNQKIKILLFERIKLLKSLKFITDSSIGIMNKPVEGFFKDINEVFFNGAGSILSTGRIKAKEQNNVINSLFIMLKGLERGLFEKNEQSVKLKLIENDIDFFLARLLPVDSEEE